MDFLALDFETANADFTSVCQVGAVLFRDGQPADTFISLVDPEDYFDAVNVSIHGIDEEAVRGAPKFGEVYAKLGLLMANRVVVSHTSFDRSVMSQCEQRHNLTRPDCKWLDSAMVVRRTWPRYARRGYGLGNVALELGIEFRHHDAAEDARAAGRILVCALIEVGPCSRTMARSGQAANCPRSCQTGRPRRQSSWPAVWRGHCLHGRPVDAAQ